MTNSRLLLQSNKHLLKLFLFFSSLGIGENAWLTVWMCAGPTGQELGEGLGAGGGDRKGQFVHSDSVSHGQTIDPSVRNLSGQQLP